MVHNEAGNQGPCGASKIRRALKRAWNRGCGVAAGLAAPGRSEPGPTSPQRSRGQAREAAARVNRKPTRSPWHCRQTGARAPQGGAGPGRNDQTVPPTELAMVLALEVADAVRLPPAMMLMS